MSEEWKRKFTETIDILKDLDEKSLVILNSGAKMLKAKEDLEKVDTEKKAG